VTVIAAAVGLTLVGKALDVSLPVALVAVYPLALALLGFYLAPERARLRRLVLFAR
jgi:hypothetical protein